MFTRRVSPRRHSHRKPKSWAETDRPMARLPFWVALVVALFAWAIVEGGPEHRALAFAGVILAGVVQLAEDHRRATANRIREALRLADINLNAAALWMYGDERRATDLVKALNGERVLDLWRLELLPDLFHQHYAVLGVRDRGLPDYARAIAKATLGVATMQQGESA